MPKHFKGVLFQIGRGSWATATGTRKASIKFNLTNNPHRILVNREAAVGCVSQLVGLPVWDCNPISGLHQRTRVIGKIENAYIDNIKVVIEGIMIPEPLFDKRIVNSPGDLGLSFDAGKTYIKDSRNDLWEIKKMELIGVTVLPVHMAAFRTDTSFKIIGE